TKASSRSATRWSPRSKKKWSISSCIPPPRWSARSSHRTTRSVSPRKPPANSPPEITMKISREARRTARELFRLSLVNGHVNASRAEEISAALVSERPRSYLEILKEFTRLVRLELSKRHAVIESPVQLD